MTECEEEDYPRLSACPHCGRSLAWDWWCHAPEATVVDWLVENDRIGLQVSEPIPRSEFMRMHRLFDQAALKRLNARILANRRRDWHDRREARYRARITAARAEFAPPDELFFVMPRTRQLLASWGIDTISALLDNPRMFYAVSLGYKHMYAIESALRRRGMRLRK